MHLANPAGNKQYSGLKYTGDQQDARWLAHMHRLGILKEGYIYPKQERGFRDLLRKRMQLVRQRTPHILSIQNLVYRNIGKKVSGNDIKHLSIALKGSKPFSINRSLWASPLYLSNSSAKGL
ncbi:hypothetical protein [Amphritea pacifica]|uniref:hypothetical protein n=1 Tax=Amphritea pacifica TaxID=2811233 RepID=UPI0019633FD9|nr:hypothetical protein [Amphritea pacifica]MBN1006855.1 hypothetical protein [Amphritea pacifica]